MIRSGKTTRLIDRCIQELFTNGITYVYDGRGTDTQNQQTEEAFSKLISRLEAEHPKAKYCHKSGVFDGIWCYKIETHNL